MNSDLGDRQLDTVKWLDRFLPPFFESTRIHLAFFDPDFNFIMVNPAYLAGSGLTAKEILGRNHFELYPNPENQAFFENVRNSEEPASFSEKPFVYPDQPWQKTTFWDGTLTPLMGEEGQTLGLALSLVDATHRVRESQLREALDEIIFSIHPDQPLDEILAGMMKRASVATGADSAAIAMGKGEHWVIRCAHCFPQGFEGAALKSKDLPHADRVLNSRKPLLIADATQDLKSREGAFAANVPASMLILPLEARSESIGLLYYISSRPYAFDELHLNFARSLSAIFGLTLNSPILLASLNQELKKGSLLQEITAVASDKSDLPDFCRKVLEIMDDHLHLLNAGFLTLSPGGESIELKASIGLPPEVVADLQCVPRDKEGYVTNVALDRDKVITHRQDPITPVRERKLEYFGLQNSRYVAGPIRNRDKVVGVFVFSFEGRRDFTEEEMNIFKSVGNIIGPIMDNVILLQKANDRSKTFEAMLQIGGLITAGPEQDEAHARIIEYARLLLDLPAAMLLMLDDSGGFFDVVAGEGVPPKMDGSRLSAGDVQKFGLAGADPLIVEGIGNMADVDFFRDIRSAGFTGAVMTSIFFKGEVFSLLVALDKKQIQLSDELLKGLGLFASQAAISLNNAWMYGSESET